MKSSPGRVRRTVAEFGMTDACGKPAGRGVIPHPEHPLQPPPAARREDDQKQHEERRTQRQTKHAVLHRHEAAAPARARQGRLDLTRLP